MRLLLVFIATLISNAAAAQWIATGGNEKTVAFGVHDSSFYLSGPLELAHGGERLNSLYRFNPDGWADTGLDLTEGPMTTFVSLGSYFFAGSYNDTVQHGQGALTTNNGSSWKTVVGSPVGTNGTYVFGLLGVLPNGDSTVIARSRDTGKTWERIMYPPGLTYVGRGALVYTNTLRAGVTRSLDSGTTWSPVPAPFSYGRMLQMGSLVLLYQPYHFDWDSKAPPHNGMLVVSRDSGLTWDTVNIDSAGIPEFVSAVATDGKDLFVGGHNAMTKLANGVFISSDTGRTWRSANDGLGNLFHVNAFGIWDTMLYVAMAGNLEKWPFATYYRPLRELVDTSGHNAVQRPSLAMDSILVYPNPSPGLFTIEAPSTDIRSITVLNLLGQELVHAQGSGGRDGTLHADLSALAAGTYFLRIETERGVVMRKVVRE